MKYLLLLLFFCPSSFPLFHCICSAKKHHKMKEQTDETFLDEEINKRKPIVLYLQNALNNPERFISRTIPHVFFKKSAEWKFEIAEDQNNCLKLADAIIAAPAGRKKDSLYLYTWELLPVKEGIARVCITYTAPYRENDPLKQEFLVTVVNQKIQA